MKRFFKYLLFLLLLLLLAGFILPWIFQDEITRVAKKEINNSLEAEVDFGSASLSWFSRFPSMAFSLEDLSIYGIDEFEGLRLARVGSFSLSLDLWSVISGDTFTIQSIRIKDADLHVLINEQGEANYDITGHQPAAADSKTDTATSSFKLALQRYELNDVNLIYEDREGAIYTEIGGLNHWGKGDFTAQVFDLKTHTDLKMLTVGYEGVQYLEKVKAQADMNLRYFTEGTRVLLKDNKLKLNALALQFEGEVAMPADDIELDLRFRTPTNRFKSALSLVPSLYARDFEALKSSGEFTLQGSAKGTYGSDPERYPAFDLKLEAQNGTFAYPEMPTSLEDFSLQLQVHNPTAQLEGTQLHLRSFHFKAGTSELKGHAQVEQLLTDPLFDIGLTGQMNLADLNRLMPDPDYNYAGSLQTQFTAQGTLSSLEKEAYDQVEVAGKLRADSLSLDGRAWAFPVKIPAARMQFSPQRFALERFSLQMGRSDLAANGVLLNMMSYALSDELLTGRFSVRSSFLDLDKLSQWAAETDTTEPTEASDTAALEIIRLPKNVQMVLDTEVDSLRYDKLPIQRLRGTLNLAQGAARMKNLKMETLGGELALTGAYDSKPQTPAVDLNLKASAFDFYESYRHLTVVKKLLPIMKRVQGNYSLSMGFRSKLNPDMTPDMATVNGKGELQTSAINVGGQVLDRLSAALNNPNLANQNLRPLQAQFAIEDGNLEVQPFTIRTGTLEGTVHGKSYLDGQLDYTMEVEMPVGRIKAQNLLSQLNLTNRSGKLPLEVTIGGTMQDPQLKTDFGNLAKNALKSAKKAVTDKVKEEVDKARAQARQKAQALIKKAEQKGDALIAQAQAKADQLEATARQKAQQIKTEADNQAQKLLQKAGNNPLKKVAAKKAADKLRTEADKKASQVVKVAQQQGNKLVANARQKKEKLVDEAQKKADAIDD